MKRLVASILMLSLYMAVIASPVRSQDPPANAANSQPASPALTNRDVLDMLKAGLAADIIVAKIKTSETNFDTSPGALAELKAANVPDSVILAMVKGAAAAAARPETASAGGGGIVPECTVVE